MQYLRVLALFAFFATASEALVPCSRKAFFKSAMLKSFVGGAVAAVTTAGLPAVAAAADSGTASGVQPPPHSLDGRLIIITGGTSGIGLESAKMLAAGGADVVITARSESKGAKAISAVQDYLNQQNIENPKVTSVLLDLDDLESVKSFPDRFKDIVGRDRKIDVLMNNAGVMAIPDRQLTKDGYERTFQSNHLGHFALTAKLFPFLNQDARVINVSSEAYNIARGGVDLDNLNGEKGYGPWTSYGQSKLENILFTQELQRRADLAKIPITAYSLHPGAVNTDLARYMIGEEKWREKKETGPTGFFEKAVDSVISKVLKTPQQGAETQVFLAYSDKGEKGRFYSDLRPQNLPGFATDKAKAQALWEKSEELSGVQFKL
jgi:NAD(P)-dependent dehydrogenase (short-subunit alcohol dehydrogenase family)